jgi:hypothetical protein
MKILEIQSYLNWKNIFVLYFFMNRGLFYLLPFFFSLFYHLIQIFFDKYILRLIALKQKKNIF